MISLMFWFPNQPSSPPSLRSLCCLAVAELLVPWLLWLIKPIRSILLPVMLARLFYRLIAAGYGRPILLISTKNLLIHDIPFVAREIRGWFVVTYLPSVNLQQLCDSYRDKGEMDVPRELIDEIMRYNDLQTLKSCSLTSRTLYSAARPLIHRRLTLGGRSAAHGSRPKDGLHPRLCDNIDRVDVFHERYLSEAEECGFLRHGYVREVDLDLSVGDPEKVLQLRQLRALETVHSLEINALNLHQILPIFDHCFSQFVPTLRSLSLKNPCCENAHQLMEFICRFPRLCDLELVKPRGLSPNSGFVGAPPGSEGPRSQRPLPLGGHLALSGTGPLVQCLLDLPGGIRFHSIEARSQLKDLAKLLVACSSTLEILNIGCIESGKSSTLTLTH